MSASFERFMENARRDGLHLLEVQIRRNGEATDHWARFPACPRFETYSVAKTFTGAAIGMAIDEGILRREEYLADSFPEEAALASGPLARAITVGDLLAMRSGMEKPLFWRDGWERRHVRDWIRYFFENGRFVHPPGSAFLYNNANSYMLGCLLEKKAGQNLREFLRHRLFEPLGIGNPEWLDCPMGHTLAANGLALSADELGRFGQLIADGGRWDGRQLLSPAYLRDMLTAHSGHTGEYIPGDPPADAGYGLHIWLDPVQNAAFLWGIFGQYCVILPEKNAVITVLSLQDDDGGSNGHYAPSPLRKRIWEDLAAEM